MAFPLPEDLNLKLTMRRFEVLDSPTLRIRCSGDVTVRGPLTGLTAEGDLEFDEVIYRITAAASKNVEDINMDSVLAVMKGDTFGMDDNKAPALSPTEIYRSMAHEFHLNIPATAGARPGPERRVDGELWMYKTRDRSDADRCDSNAGRARLTAGTRVQRAIRQHPLRRTDQRTDN